MKADNEPVWKGYTYEQKKKLLDERLASWLTRPAPTPVVTVPVSKQMAKAVEANPESVRVSARDAEGQHRVEGPKDDPRVTVRVDLVSEVDAEGRPVWGRPGVIHEYNPLDALRRD